MAMILCLILVIFLPFYNFQDKYCLLWSPDSCVRIIKVLCTGSLIHRISIFGRSKRFLSPGQFWNPPRLIHSGSCFSLQHIMKTWKRVVEVRLYFVPTLALDWGGCSTPSTDPVINGGYFPWGKKVTARMWPFAFMSCWSWERKSYVVLLHHIRSRRVLNYVWGQFHLCFITAIFPLFPTPLIFLIFPSRLLVSPSVLFFITKFVSPTLGFIVLY
jgi:hypothetical protein